MRDYIYTYNNEKWCIANAARQGTSLIVLVPSHVCLQIGRSSACVLTQRADRRLLGNIASLLSHYLYIVLYEMRRKKCVNKLVNTLSCLETIDLVMIFQMTHVSENIYIFFLLLIFFLSFFLPRSRSEGSAMTIRHPFLLLFLLFFFLLDFKRWHKQKPAATCTTHLGPPIFFTDFGPSIKNH